LLTLAQAHFWSASVFFDEPDASTFERFHIATLAARENGLLERLKSKTVEAQVVVPTQVSAGSGLKDHGRHDIAQHQL